MAIGSGPPFGGQGHLNMPDYVLTTPRLGMRNWLPADLIEMAAISANPKVMEFFPAVAPMQQTRDFIDRQLAHFEKHGFNYFAVDRLDTGEMIGFIGLYWQTWESPFTPFFDIGWRLEPAAWGQGFATEGAKACLDAAFNRFGLSEVYAICPTLNTRSENVMQKIGMKKVATFAHPLLAKAPHLQQCVLYKKEKTND